jgi:RNA polymerase sigma-70 factor (ECF subfamily)
MGHEAQSASALFYVRLSSDVPWVKLRLALAWWGIRLACSVLDRMRSASDEASGRLFQTGANSMGVHGARNEKRLACALAANDPQAWREFQRRYDRLIMHWITKVTDRFSAVSKEDVREIHAQLMLSLVSAGHAKLRAFDPSRGRRFSGYICMLATHCAYDWLRTMRREPPKELLCEAMEIATDCPDPFETTARQERAALANRLMESFSARDRAFAALYLGHGMDPVKIARSMKISVKTVYSKKNKILTKLSSIVARLHGDAAALGTAVGEPSRHGHRPHDHARAAAFIAAARGASGGPMRPPRERRGDCH